MQTIRAWRAARRSQRLNLRNEAQTRNRPRGQALVELALALPVMLLLLGAVIDGGRLMFASITVAGAARAGAMYGAQNAATANDAAAMQQAALNDGANVTGLSATASHFCKCPNGSIITCGTGTCTNATPLLYVQVQAQAAFIPLMTYGGLFASVQLSSTAIMQVQ